MSHQILDRNRRHYESLCDMARSPRLGAEAVLNCVQCAAEFAQRHHPGRFADGAIENPALEIGTDLDRHSSRLKYNEFVGPKPMAQTGVRHVLHVVTTLIRIGGHSRMILNWVRTDARNRHSLLTLAQPIDPVPEWIRQCITESGGEMICLPRHAPLLLKSRWLRRIARSGFDLIVLHHAGDDAAPLAAFAEPGGPPVAILNHADHIFWVGPSIGDTILNLRSIGANLSRHRRYARHNSLLPIPLADPAPIGRQQARARLGLPADQIVLLSVGRAIKYIPTESHDFCRTSCEILRLKPAAHVYVLGPSEKDLRRWLPAARDRLHLLGNVDDPSLWHAAADIYFESVPFGSQTALLEAALSGLPVVPAYAPPCELVVANDDALCGIFSNPEDEVEFIERAARFMADPNLRQETGQELRRRMLSYHVGENWIERLDRFYAETCRLPHDPRPIPAAPFLATATDRALADWQTYLGDAHGSDEALRSESRDRMLECAYSARITGDYAGSLALIRRALGTSSQSVSALLQLAKLAPHWMREHLARAS